MTTRWKILVTGATGKVGGQQVQVRAAGADEARALIHRADIAAVALFDHAEAFR